MIHSLSPLVISTYGTLLAAIGAVWFRSRFLWAGLFAVAIILGCLAGILQPTALAALGLLAAACGYFEHRVKTRPMSDGIQLGLTLLLILLVVPLAFHLAPGFRNPVLAQRVVLSAHSTPYTLYLNFDKTAAGLLLLAFVCRPEPLTATVVATGVRRVGLVIVLNLAAAIVLSWAFHYVAWEPKQTSFFFPWALVNLGFVCLTEEAVFRGLIQTQLTIYLRERRSGRAVALALSSVLFGLAHFAGGPAYVALATVAGFGYGLTYQRSGRLEFSIAAHFLLNTAHFLLFTYPALAPGS